MTKKIFFSSGYYVFTQEASGLAPLAHVAMYLRCAKAIQKISTRETIKEILKESPEVSQTQVVSQGGTVTICKSMDREVFVDSGCLPEPVCLKDR
jgi:hypothetical protein